MKKSIFFLIFTFLGFLFISCSDNSNNNGIKEKYYLGIDSSWYPFEFKGEQANINGFLEELLLEVSKTNNVEIIRVDANWDTLYEGLETSENKAASYDAVISMKEPHNFNLDHYLFSPIFLETGPVIVKAIESTHEALKDLAHKRIGVVQNKIIVPLLQKNPDMLVLSYTSVGSVLNDLEKKKIEAAVISQIFAISYLKNIYPNQFSYSKPIFEEGLRFISLNNMKKGKSFTQMIEKTLNEMKNINQLSTLKKKWNLE